METLLKEGWFLNFESGEDDNEEETIKNILSPYSAKLNHETLFTHLKAVIKEVIEGSTVGMAVEVYVIDL